jgi:hypothetical protein
MLHPCLGVFSQIASCKDLSTDNREKAAEDESCVVPEIEGGWSGMSEYY